jgi:UrcA family protein
MSAFHAVFSLLRGPFLKISQACRLVSLEAALIMTVLTLFVVGMTHADEDHSVVVRYDDLDIGSIAGAATLRARIERAADRVCDVSFGFRDLHTRIADRECTEKAVGRALASVQIKSDSLTRCRAGDRACAVNRGRCSTTLSFPDC